MSSHQINEEMNRKEQHNSSEVEEAKENKRTNEPTYTHMQMLEKSGGTEKTTDILVVPNRELCKSHIWLRVSLDILLQPAHTLSHTQYQLMDFEFRHYTNDLSSVCCG